MRRVATMSVFAALAFVGGCYTEHKIQTVHEMKPIHITLDVNIRIDKELEKSFAKRDEVARSIDNSEAEKALEAYLKNQEKPKEGEQTP